jgi:hypothetical protein
MKWDKAIIVLLDPNNWVCRSDALAWKSRYSVPDELCFADFKAGYGLKGFRQLGPRSLVASDTRTKIIVVSHASSVGIAVEGLGYYPHDVAQVLREWGLRAVGLLAFRGCNLGKAVFLDALASCLSAEGIRCGWLIGYRHSASQLLGSSHECTGFLDVITRYATFGASKLPDNYRVKVVKGNIDIVPPNGGSPRYPARQYPPAGRLETTV